MNKINCRCETQHAKSQPKTHYRIPTVQQNGEAVMQLRTTGLSNISLPANTCENYVTVVY